MFSGELTFECSWPRPHSAEWLQPARVVSSKNKIIKKHYSTFGLPVVPLEKLKNAIFVLPSPGDRRRSWNDWGINRPSSMSSGTLGYRMAL